MKFAGALFCIALTICPAYCFAQQEGEGMAIQEGSKVAFHYELTVDGDVVDSSKERDPMEYTHGEGKIIPGLSKQLIGLKKGDEQDIIVPPEEAYGTRNPDAVKEVPRSQLPAEVQPRTGMPLQVMAPDGSKAIVMIAEVKNETVVIDFNHPLAGKTLNFHIKIVSVQ
jgi:FKBP-type peptidyl-prolyl cis-trans isomerase 2